MFWLIVVRNSAKDSESPTTWVRLSLLTDTIGSLCTLCGLWLGGGGLAQLGWYLYINVTYVFLNLKAEYIKSVNMQIGSKTTCSIDRKGAAWSQSSLRWKYVHDETH